MTLSRLETRRTTRRDVKFTVVPRKEHPSDGLRRIGILMIDDEPTFLRIAQLFLETHHGQEVEILGTARSGEEGLSKAQLLAPQVVLIDLNMPGLSGLQTIPLIRIMFPEMRIIALTLNDDEKSRRAVMAAGGNDLVSKTRMSTELMPTIRRVMADEMIAELAIA